jgi:hypothetical protein
MPPTAYIDHVSNLSLVERNGAIRSLTRKARVGFHQGDWPQDFSVLNAALAVCPAPMSTLDTPGYAGLVLVERNPSLLDNDPGWVDVILKYEHLLDGPNQGLFRQTAQPPVFFGRGRVSIAEKTTNFFYPYGDTTKQRVQILVAHTFPNSDIDIVGPFLDQVKWPRTVFQGGEVTVPFPQANYHIVGYLNTASPWLVADNFIAHINEFEWLSKPPLTWICSEVQFEMMDPDPTVPIAEDTTVQTEPLYKFEFEFQYNVDTWAPTVVFNDQRTGRPPAGVLPGIIPGPDDEIGFAAGVDNFNLNPVNQFPQPAGYWTVPVVKLLDFQSEFETFFDMAVGP